MKVILMWTIHDFPDYVIISSCQHQGYTCLPCGTDIVNRWSKELGKPIFQGSWRWLWINHPYRTYPNAKRFDGKKEVRGRPKTITTIETLKWTQMIEDWVATCNVLGAKGCPSHKTRAKHWSALFQLPYWDVNHTIDNVFDK